MIALYQGRSLMSRLIRWRTWSPYSHASWIDGAFEIEAWRGGVRQVERLGADHTPGTRVELYEIAGLAPAQAIRIVAFLRAQIGKPYDLRGVLGFISRRDGAQDQGRWFCSELVFEACRRAGVELLARIPAHRVPPGLLAISPLLISHEPQAVTIPPADPAAFNRKVPR